MEKIKTVNVSKLSGMTDIQLADRIKKSGQKSEDKKKRTIEKIKMLEKQLADYLLYRDQDIVTCKKILEDRQKTKAVLPKGGNVSSQVKAS